MAEHFTDPYQWDMRPKVPARPQWFRAWPGGARIALHIIILNEWESAPWHRSRPMPAGAHHKTDFLALGAREYGARHGVWRILEVLDKHKVKATMVTSGLIGELFPETVRAAKEQGHEIATHQYDQFVFPPTFKTREEERASLVRSVAALEQASGGKIEGYMSPGPRPTPNTLGILAELGFRWTSDYVDCDFPYLIETGGKKLVAIGYAQPGYVDADLMGRGVPQGLAEIKYAFDATYEEARRHPMIFNYAVHTHWGGTVGMARLLDDFLAHAKSREGVWLPRCTDIASFWLAGGA